MPHLRYGSDSPGSGRISFADPDAIHLTKEAVQLANVHTTVVSKQSPVREVRLYGKVQADERLIQSQVAHVTGRIEELYVNFTGEPVKNGQPLARIYSPELVTAQQELLEASKTKSTQPAIYEASREKLRQWKLTDSQIETIENSGTVLTAVDITSNTSGIVTMKQVNTGDYVTQGAVLFRIADLSRVWILFDVYESDLQLIRKNEKVKFTLQAFPGTDFSGTIVFIDPVIDPVTRVARIRVEAGNQSGRLMPEMFATGIVSSSPGKHTDDLVIPKSAVLWTGKRSIVYVKQPDSDEPAFRMREIGLGPMAGDGYIVTDGLAEGEEIVTMGAFSVDAAAQLEGKPSMMNATAGEPVTGHDHSQMTVKGEAPVKSTLLQETFGVSGLCSMCKDRIESAARSVRGVKSASWDQETQLLKVSFDSSLTTLDAIQKTIADAGHDNVDYRAPDDVYNNLPECCLYRK
ncbi:MAG: efflux RND transporter periplasmic adaptor subunit [Marinilabiliales bacterium]|nr:efflux RND transporter periplasmic adaptor subunit [Marinilabiliales bacterium]